MVLTRVESVCLVTILGMRADVFGLAQRGGVKGTVAAGGSGNFSPRTGLRPRAVSRSDTDLLMLLFETYGGWSEPVVRLFRRMHDKVRNKLTKRQYENEVSCGRRRRGSRCRHSAFRWRCT